MRGLDVYVLKFAEVHLLVSSLSSQLLISRLLMLDQPKYRLAFDGIGLFLSTTVARFTAVVVPTDGRFGRLLPGDLYGGKVTPDLFTERIAIKLD
jgi:hypothetical protein